MAPQPVGRVALMSIHPEFAEAILAGSKRVEFRKRPLADDVTHVIVYATAPVMAVVGAFSIAGQDVAAPSTLWRRFSDVAGISRRRFFDYFASSRSGTGIRVGNVLIADTPLPLNKTLGVDHPPQSFQYVCPMKATKTIGSMAAA